MWFQKVLINLIFIYFFFFWGGGRGGEWGGGEWGGGDGGGLLLHLRVRQKALQLPLFSSISLSLQQIWTDRRKLLVEFSRFKLDECGFIQIHETNVT